MSDPESRREDFVRGDHDVVPTVTITAQLTFVVDNDHPDGEVIFAEEYVEGILDDMAHQFSPALDEYEIIKTEVN